MAGSKNSRSQVLSLRTSLFWLGVIILLGLALYWTMVKSSSSADSIFGGRGKVTNVKDKKIKARKGKKQAAKDVKMDIRVFSDCTYLPVTGATVTMSAPLKDGTTLTKTLLIDSATGMAVESLQIDPITAEPYPSTIGITEPTTVTVKIEPPAASARDRLQSLTRTYLVTPGDFYPDWLYLKRRGSVDCERGTTTFDRPGENQVKLVMTVKDKKTGTALSDAMVSVARNGLGFEPLYTNESGQASIIYGLTGAADKFTVETSAAGYTTLLGKVDNPQSGATESLAISLEPKVVTATPGTPGSRNGQSCVTPPLADGGKASVAIKTTVTTPVTLDLVGLSSGCKTTIKSAGSLVQHENLDNGKYIVRATQGDIVRVRNFTVVPGADYSIVLTLNQGNEFNVGVRTAWDKNTAYTTPPNFAIEFSVTGTDFAETNTTNTIVAMPNGSYQLKLNDQSVQKDGSTYAVSGILVQSASCPGTPAEPRGCLYPSSAAVPIAEGSNVTLMMVDRTLQTGPKSGTTQ